MTNYEFIKNMSIEEMALFLANETDRIAKPIYDIAGMGICKEVIAVKRLQWLKKDVSCD